VSWSLWARNASSSWSPRLPTPMKAVRTLSLAPSTREYPAALSVAAVAAAALVNVRRFGEGMEGSINAEWVRLAASRSPRRQARRRKRRLLCRGHFELLRTEHGEVEPVRVVAVGDLQQHGVLPLRQLHPHGVLARGGRPRLAHGEHLLAVDVQ